MSSLALKPERLSLRARLDKLTTEELRAELAQLLSMTAQNLLRLAMVVDLLNERGDKVTFGGRKFVKILAAIACGSLLPEIVANFSGNTNIIMACARLTIKEQEDIVSGKTVPPQPKKYWKMTKALQREAGITEEGDYRKALRLTAKIGNPKDVGEMAANLILDSKVPSVALEELARIMKEKRLWR